MEIFLKRNSDPNIHQNAPNCTILKKILGGACPRTPPSKAHGKSEKNFPPPPPLPNPGDAPASLYTTCIHLLFIFKFLLWLFCMFYKFSLFFFKIWAICGIFSRPIKKIFLNLHLIYMTYFM